MATKNPGNTRVLVARRSIGLSQGKLGSHANLNANDIVRIERRGWIPPADVRKKLAKALDSTPEALFGDDLRAPA